jgi:hypothetical protein
LPGRRGARTRLRDRGAHRQHQPDPDHRRDQAREQKPTPTGDPQPSYSCTSALDNDESRTVDARGSVVSGAVAEIARLVCDDV